MRAVEKGRAWIPVGGNQDLPADRALYHPAYREAVEVLPKIRNKQLIREAEGILREANQVLEELVPKLHG